MARVNEAAIARAALTQIRAAELKKQLLTTTVKNCRNVVAKLAGGVAVIEVGAATEVEMKEKKATR